MYELFELCNYFEVKECNCTLVLIMHILLAVCSQVNSSVWVGGCLFLFLSAYKSCIPWATETERENAASIGTRETKTMAGQPASERPVIRSCTSSASAANSPLPYQCGISETSTKPITKYIFSLSLHFFHISLTK